MPGIGAQVTAAIGQIRHLGRSARVAPFCKTLKILARQCRRRARQFEPAGMRHIFQISRGNGQLILLICIIIGRLLDTKKTGMEE